MAHILKNFPDRSFSNKVKKFFESFDDSEKEIRFNYKGEEHLKTVFGGIMSIVSKIIMFAYIYATLSTLARGDNVLQ